MLKKHLTSRQKDRCLVAIEQSLPALRAFARGLCGNRVEADDLVQSACEKALRSLHQVHDIAGIKSWLNRIIYTCYQDQIRTSTRKSRNLIHLAEYQQGSHSKHSSVKEDHHITRIDVHAALGSLKPDYRAAVVLVSMLGCSYTEVAEILEIPPGTVASRVARGRKQLAEILNDAEQSSMQKLLSRR